MLSTPFPKIHSEKDGIICTTFRYLKCSDLFPIFLSKTTLFQLNFFFCTKLIIFLNQTPRSSSTPVKLGNVYKWYLISIYLQGVCLKNICVGNLAIEKYLHQVDNTSKRSLSLPVLQLEMSATHYDEFEPLENVFIYKLITKFLYAHELCLYLCCKPIIPWGAYIPQLCIRGLSFPLPFFTITICHHDTRYPSLSF